MYYDKKKSRPSRTRDIVKKHIDGGRGEGQNRAKLIEKCKWESGLIVCYLGH
mgnify:CR=1 FL=1